MAIKPRVKGIPAMFAYAQLSTFAGNVVAAMTLNVAFYATPNPALAAITAAKATLDALIALWGPVGARGSHADLMALRAAAFTLRSLLVQEAGYVQNTVVAAGGSYATQASNMSDSGYGVKNPGLLQGVLNAPENFHQSFKSNISPLHTGLDWEKPLGLNSPGNVKNYQVWRNPGTNNFNDPATVCIGTVTKTSFLDITSNKTLTNYYWVTASNTNGIGVPAGAVIVAPF